MAIISSLITISGSTRIYAEWVDGNNLGAPNTSHRVTKKQGSGSEILAANIPDEDRCIIDSLAVTTPYTIFVYPTNISGEGAALSSTLSTVASSTLPDAPTNLVLQIHENGFSLDWTPSVNTGGKSITFYILEFRINDGQWLVLPQSHHLNPQARVTNLARKRKTDLRVYAVTDNGIGEPSSIVTIPAVP